MHERALASAMRRLDFLELAILDPRPCGLRVVLRRGRMAKAYQGTALDGQEVNRG